MTADNTKADIEPQNQPVPHMVETCVISPAEACAASVKTPSLSASDQEFVRRCVDVVVGICCLYGFDDEGYSRKGTYDHWIKCAALFGDAMKFVKYKTAAFYAVHVPSNEPQELPPAPVLDGVDNPGCILSGRGYSWLQRVIKHDKLWESFLCTILAAKKGMPRPNKERLLKAERATFKKLTTFRPDTNSYWLRNWSDPKWETKGPTPEYYVSRTTMSSEIRRTVREIFTGLHFDEDLAMAKPRFPSTSANYINSRGRGGAVGPVLGILQSEDLSANEPLVQQTTFVGSGQRSDRNIGTGVDLTALDWKFAQLSSRLLAHARREEAVAVPVALAEALKTRVITKGPPLLMTVLKPFQSFCRRALSRLPVFELTGRTIDSDYIQSRLGKRLAPGQKYLSVDYSDATNEIHSWCSEVAAEEICSVLGTTLDFELLVKRSLTGHTIEYDGESADQETGQLMGSVTSFIFLCIVNAAICRWSIELDQDKCILLRDCQLAINGDDAVFRVTDFGKECWEKVASVAGMSPSIGKVYHSTSFLNMNSTTFRHVPEGFECEYSPMWTVVPRKYFTTVPYVNMGLLYGLTRSSAGDLGVSFSGTKDPSLGAKCRELVGTAPSALSEKLIAKFIRTYDDQLKQFPIPWFIPEHLGGCGLPCAGRFRPEKPILQVAAKMLRYPELFPLPSIPRNVPWKTWQLAMKLNPLPKVTSSMVSSAVESGATMSYNDYWSKCVVALLFERGQSIRNLMAKPSTPKIEAAQRTLSMNAHRKLAQSWTKARHDASKMPFYSFPPLDPNHYPTYHSVNDFPLLVVSQQQPWFDFVTTVHC